MAEYSVKYRNNDIIAAIAYLAGVQKSSVTVNVIKGYSDGPYQAPPDKVSITVSSDQPIDTTEMEKAISLGNRNQSLKGSRQ